MCLIAVCAVGGGSLLGAFMSWALLRVRFNRLLLGVNEFIASGDQGAAAFMGGSSLMSNGSTGPGLKSPISGSRMHQVRFWFR